MRGLSFSISLLRSRAFWSSTRILSPLRSNTTTSSLSNLFRVVVTFSFPVEKGAAAPMDSINPPRMSPKGLPAWEPPLTLAFSPLGQIRSVGEE